MSLANPAINRQPKIFQQKGKKMTAHDPSTLFGLESLTPEEAGVIIHKGTERPNSGALLHTKDAGWYICRSCGAALYRSEHKFESGCGWPSFDQELPDAVRRSMDADGRRTEITCARCNAHLGHVFSGEGFTPTNTRHCVNSISMRFVPDTDTALAYFAGGCFWGVEDFFNNLPGVIRAVSGYMGGDTENPTYEQVCTGRSGHAETVEVLFATKLISFETLARLFFEIHDPTQLDAQGPDRGPQYRSAVFPANAEQAAITASLIEQLEKQGWDVVTSVEELSPFYPAEDYHQRFLHKHPQRPACHRRVPRFTQGPLG